MVTGHMCIYMDLGVRKENISTLFLLFKVNIVLELLFSSVHRLSTREGSTQSSKIYKWIKVTAMLELAREAQINLSRVSGGRVGGWGGSP